MIENFLHYVWLYKKIDILHLQTTQLEPLEVISVGFPNPNSGPDFFNGQLRIGEHIWIGNIEIHIKSSDWYIHNHQNDDAYDNVILHVVYEHDVEIYRRDNSVIPTLELQNYINQDLLTSYEKLVKGDKRFINCDFGISAISKFVWHEWIDKLYFERLNERCDFVAELINRTNGDWEAVLFMALAKSFGSNVNGDAFLSIAKSFDFKVIQKLSPNAIELEALFFGQSGLLDTSIDDSYHKKLQVTYNILKQKFQLDSAGVQKLKFFRLRPINFPTIRLSQLAVLYAKESRLFSKIIETETIRGYYDLLRVKVTKYWESNYTFKNTAKSSTKLLTKPYIDLLLMNTILPIKFYYAKEKGLDISEHIVQLMSTIASETNSIIKNFEALKVRSPNAFYSQALIQLKTVYCDHNKCLKCSIGHVLLSK
ncbi:DUF2851 family protein [Psychroserpens sp.]|uniref:DUF2851 family protein n=1 Tax=Psychroserpens sp. TaxID=2020870 RepID=UPI001B18F6D2|nr:DUF2851 family protein [Psychroserpens sp.]MBO6606029.1 DUF2851 family protein [Psychroserpens sp.]MBO6630335.1 DUF2851 family protein [Psychroserpens sp.]MBO6652600.1 DUF2851 family protein [Psychroserpens sp.]MBO6681628.1 DUF2851 family protein [Psychroserpens sp.]MBO6749403.1 DUF2851 family protein [Psychroserpens sp.]